MLDIAPDAFAHTRLSETLDLTPHKLPARTDAAPLPVDPRGRHRPLDRADLTAELDRERVGAPRVVGSILFTAAVVASAAIGAALKLGGWL